LVPGRALDLGCGPGRNALHLAARGFQVDAVDLSPAAIGWAEERAREAGVGMGTAGSGVRAGGAVRFHCGDAFTLTAGTTAELRARRQQPADSPLFGEEFLWTALFRRPGQPAPVHRFREFPAGRTDR